MKSFKNPGGRSLALALHSLYYSVKKGIRQFDDDDDDLGGDLRVEVAGDCDVHIGIQANSTSSSDPHHQDLHQGARLGGAPCVGIPALQHHVVGRTSQTLRERKAWPLLRCGI